LYISHGGVSLGFGRASLTVISKFRRKDDLSGFTKAVLALPHVERTNTHVVLNTCKEDFRHPCYGLNLDTSWSEDNPYELVGQLMVNT